MRPSATVHTFIRKCGFELRRIPSNRHCAESTYAPYSMQQRLLELRNLGFRPQYFLDGGANLGDLSMRFIQTFPSARSYLFEPMQELAPGLNAFVESHPGCKFFPGALSSATGVAVMHVDPTCDPKLASQSLAAKPTPHTTPRHVKTYCIDDLLDKGDIHMPEVIKLVVEGYELEVLKGASKTFGQTEVYILAANFWKVGNKPDLNDVITYMGNHGYVPYDFGGLVRRPRDWAPGLVYILFVKRDGFFRRSTSWV